MSRKKFIILIGVIGILVNILILKFVSVDINDKLIFSMDISSGQSQIYQVFYSDNGIFTEEQSISYQYNDIESEALFQYEIPESTNYIRIDFGNQPSDHIINELYFTCNNKKFSVNNSAIDDNNANMISSTITEDNKLLISSNGNDPFCVIDINKLGIREFIKDSHFMKLLLRKLVACLIIDVILMIFVRLFDTILMLTSEILRNRKLIFNLAKNDFKTKYAGSYLGIIWAFVQPVTTVLVYWFVFQVGFRSGSVSDYPFVLWFIAGLIPWFFFADAITGATSSFIEYSYLVKKVVFRISVLPIVKIISALFVHTFFAGFLLITYILNGHYPDLYTIQVVYYSFCMFILALGITYATSSIIIFFKDLSQIINIILQIGMWITPIMWNFTIIPDKYRWIFEINPMYYIVEGYRDAMINKVWFWENMNLTIYFWTITALIFVVGATIFKRLKIHFADVL